MLTAGIVALAAFLVSAGRLLVIDVPLDEPDVIVSLGSHEWERLPIAAGFARRYPHSIVLLTLPDEITEHNCHDCLNRVHRMQAMGVPQERVLVLPLTRAGTQGEAVAVRDFVSRSHRTRLLIVTSPYHTRRALAVFRSVTGNRLEIGVVPAQATSEARPARWWTAPYDRWYVAYEWAAAVYYAVRYRIFTF